MKAIAYAIDRDDEKQRQFQNILRGIGFEVKLKPFIRRHDGSTKGDWDVGITLDILDYVPHVDIVVLASGDGDFDLLVQKIIEQYGVSVEVYGVAELTAGSLIRAASKLAMSLRKYTFSHNTFAMRSRKRRRSSPRTPTILPRAGCWRESTSEH